MVRGRPDVTIVGGGPAGAALAIVLGRRGVKVVLYEKAVHPRPKPCGEGLLPHGVSALRRIAGLPDAPCITGLTFTAGDKTVDAGFSGEVGLVLRRDRFDAWLFDQAATTPNVDARSGTPYRPGPTTFLVGADGARSMFHRQLKARSARPHRVGLSTHVTGVEGLRDRVEVFFHDEGELYIAPTGGGEALVAGLFEYRHFRRDGITYLLNKTVALRHRLSRIELTTPVIAAAPLGVRVPRIVDCRERLLLVGDAAGTPDPITAGGLALALTATNLAADAIVSGALDHYERRRLAMGRRVFRLGWLMQHLGRSERRASWVLRHGSAAIQPLVDAAVGGRTPSVETHEHPANGALRCGARSSGVHAGSSDSR